MTSFSLSKVIEGGGTFNFNSISGMSGPGPGAGMSFIFVTRHLCHRCPNDFLGLSLNDRMVLFLMILFDKTGSVG